MLLKYKESGNDRHSYMPMHAGYYTEKEAFSPLYAFQVQITKSR